MKSQKANFRLTEKFINRTNIWKENVMNNYLKENLCAEHPRCHNPECPEG